MPNFQSKFFKTFSALGLSMLSSLFFLMLPGYAGSATELPLRINAGGAAIGKPGDPNHWVPGSKFIKGGAPYAFGPGHDLRQIDSPGPAQIYETVHHQDHDYRIDGLAAGDYLLRFHFTEGYDTHKRAMDYRINGKLAIDDLNILAITGKVRKAHVVEVRTQLKEGQALTIECREGSGVDVFEAGIEIIPVNPSSKKAPPSKPVPPAPPTSKTSAAPLTGTAAEIRQVTGAQTRLVWLQGSVGYHYTGPGNLTRLMGFDTDDGRGEHQILPEEKSFSKPLLTPNGNGIVFSDRARKNRHAYFINWDGSGLRDLGKGFASDIWRDPATGQDWVYLRRGDGGLQDRIVRRRLDKPDVEERVWSRTKNGHQGVPWFQLSADGRRFSNAFPWSHCGLGNLDSGKWKKYTSGCWPSIAPDNSYRMFIFSGSHKEISIFDEGGKNLRTVNVANIPGQQGSKVYFPRWSNDVRFLTVSSPEKHPKAELFLGKFAEDLKSIDRWIQVTHNDRADIFGDTWINPQASAPKGAIMTRPVPPKPSDDEIDPKLGTEWPGTAKGLVWVWDNANAQNEAPPRSGETEPFSCLGQLHGRARLGRHFELLLDGGSFTAGDDAGARITAACQKTNAFTVEALVETFATKQEGPARILSLSGNSIERNLTLGQEGEWLVLRLRTGHDDLNGTRHETRLCKLVANSPLHIVLSHRQGETVCYLNGKETLRSDRFGDLKSWAPMPLNLGDEQGGGRDWKGSLQAIALYDRFIGPQEAAKHFSLAAARLQNRKPAVQTVLSARLVETVPLPTLEEMGTYRRALVENVYQVEKVISGPLPEGTPRIVVNQWVVMDRKPLPSAANLKPGLTTTLTLEAMSDHPELSSEFRSSDHSEFNAPLFYDVNSQH